MTYWHMQLSSKAHLRGRLKRILEENSLIDFADIEENKQIINKFRENVKVNDLILIKNKDRPIVLVQISELLKNIEFTNSYQCKVKIIDWATTTMDKYPLGSMTQELQAINPNSILAYNYIQKWYVQGKEILINGVKLRKLYIDDYNNGMIKNLEIDFIDKEDKPLNIIVLVGINGSGKTTLLEYIQKNHLLNIGAFYANNKDFIELEENNKIKFLNNEAKKKRKEIDDYLKRIVEIKGSAGISYNEDELYLEDLDKKILYIKVYEDNVVKDIKQNILEFYRRESREIDSYSETVNNLKIFINKIFDGLEINFFLEDVDDISKEEVVQFKNSSGLIFRIERLSTGEKTLLSKVLNLYFKDIKNQIILIDEPELSLHPSWQNKVLSIYERFAKEYNCQIILATHSPHIIGSAKNEYIRVLKKDKITNEIKILNNLKAHGRDINSVLFDVMGEVLYRHDEFRKKIDRLFYAIEDEKNYELSKKLFDELKEDYGENDSIILEAKMLISMTFGE
ncbi:AAA family ATPase [Aliarcobacter vitoriensis]|uniref:AAA family ATPase n=1 Tax=Aliarcobacter vitoriensis TaxID=2011099 RepID=UPI003AAC566A